MSLHHKFQKFDWKNGFYTENAILKTPYKPEVIFIGTFNHGWSRNTADFFYGRDMYMWPILANLFLHNDQVIKTVRNSRTNNPTLDEIFQICRNSKITFADVISGLNSIPSVKETNKILWVNNEFKWTNYSDKQLNALGNRGWLNDNVVEIVKYINENRSIKHVYFTFKSEAWLLQRRSAIIRQVTANSGSIFTPTGMGFRKNLQSFPNRCFSLSHCWIWNGIHNKTPIHKPGYINLDHYWLKSKGVNVE